MMQPKQKSEKIVRATHPSASIRADYRRRLERLTKEMQASFEYWISAAYKKNPPNIALDASPSKEMERRIKELGRSWQKKYNEAAKPMSDWFIGAAQGYADFAFTSALAAAEFNAAFKMTAAAQDVFSAAVAENVALIKSIPQQYLAQAQGIVMRGFTRGRDLAYIVEELRARHKIDDNRIKLIARDQTNKAHAVFTQQRQKEIGIVEAFWLHSSAGKVPRPDHVAADGEIYEIGKGCLISGEYIFPGQLINCRCVSRSILPF